MKIIPVKVENGVLKIPDDFSLDAENQLSILLTKKGEVEVSFLEGNSSFSFLYDEPDLYTDVDIVAERRNQKFSK